MKHPLWFAAITVAVLANGAVGNALCGVPEATERAVGNALRGVPDATERHGGRSLQRVLRGVPDATERHGGRSLQRVLRGVPGGDGTPRRAFPTALEAADTPPKKDRSAFGAFESVSEADARIQAQAWLKSVKGDEKKFAALWATDAPLLDKVSATLALGDADAAKLLANAKDDSAPAPTQMPAALKDAKKGDFYRNNLTLAYARALTTRKVYEEALEAFLTVKPEDVVDPAAYFFHRAVCEYELMIGSEANKSIAHLLEDVTDSPERYRIVAALMHFDLLTWQEKDLGWIARKMDNIQRRLDLARGGKKTQRMQKEVLVRLDEMIKELENAQNPMPPASDLDDGQKQPRMPAPDTPPGQQPPGKGDVHPRVPVELAEVWGKLPEKERAKVFAELTRNMPAKDRAVIEAYFKELTRKSGK